MKAQKTVLWTVEIEDGDTIRTLRDFLHTLDEDTPLDGGHLLIRRTHPGKDVQVSNETTAALIQSVIEDALMDETCPVVDTFTTVRRVDEGTYFIEGDIYADELAKVIAAKLAPEETA